MRMEGHVQAGRPQGRQIPPAERPRSDGELPETAVKGPGLDCQEKLLVRTAAPVPQTDTGRQEENSKVRGKTLVKELGKIYP